MPHNHFAIKGHTLQPRARELKYVKKILAGHGKRNLVLDFKDVAVVGKRNTEPLSAIGFDIANLDKSEALHDKLSNLLSEADMSPGELEELKTMAYQAYTFLQESVSEIRENGQYVFV